MSIEAYRGKARKTFEDFLAGTLSQEEARAYLDWQRYVFFPWTRENEDMIFEKLDEQELSVRQIEEAYDAGLI